MYDKAAGRLTVKSKGSAAYDIWYRDSFDDLSAALTEAGLADRRVLIVTDSNVSPLYGEAVKNALSPAAEKVLLYVLPAGEENKNLDTLMGLYRFLIREGFDRKCLLAALGGGVVGDMTGLAAATYLRGVDFIQIPTTLLAQADSSIGGKTGVDCDGYKNMIGAFCMPRLVYANVSVLKTLNGLQYASGFAEVMKHGIIRDADYYVWLLENMYEILDRDSDTLQAMLYRSNEIKKEIVEKDPKEMGQRRLLNFGHTIGHAIEKYKNFTLTHGACVALGSVCAAWISWQKGYLDMDEYYEIRDMFVPFGLPITDDDLDPAAVAALTLSDKKMEGGKIRFVLLKKIGSAFVDDTVTLSEIEDAVRQILWTEDGE